MQVQRESAICNAQEVKRLVGVIHVQVIAHTCAGEAPGTTSILVCVCVWMGVERGVSKAYARANSTQGVMVWGQHDQGVQCIEV